MKASNATIEPPEIIIEGGRKWVPLNLHEVWEFRDLLFFFIKRDLKGRYRQMALGPLWAVINPLISMGLYTIIFGMVAKLPTEGVPYPLFSFAALLPWSFFASALDRSANCLLTNRGLISKVYFPRLIIPITGVVAALVDFLISFVILLIMMFAYGYHPTWAILILPLLLIVAGATALAVGLWTACWIVHFYDLNNILTLGVRFWMYATPVVYAITTVPEQWRTLYRLNPMTNVVESFRWAMLGTGEPPGIMLLISGLLVVPFLISGAYMFRKTERTIVDIA